MHAELHHDCVSLCGLYAVMKSAQNRLEAILNCRLATITIQSHHHHRHFCSFFCCCCLWCRTKAIMQITKCLRTWIKYHEKRQKSLISSTRTFYDNDALHRTTCSDQKLAGWMPLFKTIFFGSQGEIFMFVRGIVEKIESFCPLWER